ncbi:MAG: hypothetical protein OXI96_09235 [Acidimicrobiaceae bacterium]|nr:hypothetical protein [Acidimicrobiaceae bacterium]
MTHRECAMKWNDYYLTQGGQAFKDLWADRGQTPTLVVIGGGFDPRTIQTLSAIASTATAELDIVRLEFSTDIRNKQANALVTNTRNEIERIAHESGTLRNHSYPETTSKRTAGLALSRSFHEAGYLDGHNEMVIDISGLSRWMYFPLIKSMLKLEEQEKWKGDLHVVVCDNPRTDTAIRAEGAETVDPLGGFGFVAPAADVSSYEKLERDMLQKSFVLKVWVPILGEGRIEELESIWGDITPDEVFPVLPFPSLNPRRADDLLLEYREFFFDEIEVETRNFIHASESNPFDLYRSLKMLNARYQDVLEGLGRAEFVLSSHSSKLLSVGALIAGHEFQMQILHVSSTRSWLDLDTDFDQMQSDGILSDIWLTGAPYT